MSVEINADYEAFKLLDDSRVYKYLSSIATLPCNFDIRTIANFNVCAGDSVESYQHCYYESTPTRPEDSDKGVEGFVIGYKNKDPKKDVVYILDIINGEFVKISYKGQEISDLTGSIVDIGRGAKCGLLSDFMSYILLDQRIDKPEPYQIAELVNLMNIWFDKSTNELGEEMDRLEGLHKEKQKGKIMVDLNKLDLKTFHVPSKKFADMFQPNFFEIDLKFEKDNDIFRMWTTSIMDEALGYDEESLFLAMGNILYVFNQIEQLVWVQHLDQEVEGYETIPANSLVTKIFELFLKCVSTFHQPNIEKDGLVSYIVTKDTIYKEIALLLIACTNTEIANENLSMPELIAATSELIGYDFTYVNPKIKGL